jgi:hypothetical protein
MAAMAGGTALNPTTFAALAAATFAMLLTNIALRRRKSLLDAALICSALALPGLVALWKIADKGTIFSGAFLVVLHIIAMVLSIAAFLSIALPIFSIRKAAGWTLVGATVAALMFGGFVKDVIEPKLPKVPETKQAAPPAQQQPS